MSSNIEVKLDVLNQKASPALYAAPLADRPAASFTGRLFVDSDSPSTGLYRDTGSAWVQIADAGAGTTGTLQQVTTNGNTTSIGISVTANGIGIGTTIPATNRLDIHSSSGINATFNGTGTSNAALQLQLAGTAKWNLSNFYNAGANDFIVADVTNSLNRITVKNTGQTFIGADTTSSGLLVVNSATSDNHIVILGANAPSIRLRNAGTSPTLNAGLGISTATNNFIQSSANGNFCIFNASTTASPILFGIYDSGAGNTVEAVRISASRNFLIGTITDAGQKLQVNGSSAFAGNMTNTTPYFAIGSSTTIRSYATILSPNLTQASTTANMYITTSDTQNINIGGSLGFGGQIASATDAPFAVIAGRKETATNNNSSGYFVVSVTDGGNSVIERFRIGSTGTATFTNTVNIGNSVAAGVAVASTHKVSILIGGVQYYLLASNI